MLATTGSAILLVTFGYSCPKAAAHPSHLDNTSENLESCHRNFRECDFRIYSLNGKGKSLESEKNVVKDILVSRDGWIWGSSSDACLNAKLIFYTDNSYAPFQKENGVWHYSGPTRKNTFTIEDKILTLTDGRSDELHPPYALKFISFDGSQIVLERPTGEEAYLSSCTTSNQSVLAQRQAGIKIRRSGSQIIERLPSVLHLYHEVEEIFEPTDGTYANVKDDIVFEHDLYRCPEEDTFGCSLSLFRTKILDRTKMLNGDYSLLIESGHKSVCFDREGQPRQPSSHRFSKGSDLSLRYPVSVSWGVVRSQGGQEKYSISCELPPGKSINMILSGNINYVKAPQIVHLQFDYVPKVEFNCSRAQKSFKNCPSNGFVSLKSNGLNFAILSHAERTTNSGNDILADYFLEVNENERLRQNQILSIKSAVEEMFEGLNIIFTTDSSFFSDTYNGRPKPAATVYISTDTTTSNILSINEAFGNRENIPEVRSTIGRIWNFLRGHGVDKEGNSYSLISNFRGIAEHIDIDNKILEDKAFVFPVLPSESAGKFYISSSVKEIARVISHEVAHLLGVSHPIDEDGNLVNDGSMMGDNSKEFYFVFSEEQRKEMERALGKREN